MKKCKLFNVLKRKTKGIKAGGYLRELSIVIIGVATTFLLSDAINTSKERKDLNKQLNMIYVELENNLNKVNSLIKLYDNHLKLGSLLSQTITDPEQVDRDSLKKYSATAFFMDLFTYQKSAYEMFVSNGGMKFLSDHKLLLDISETYAMLEATKEENNIYNSIKLAEFQLLYRLEPKEFIRPSPLTDSKYNGFFNFFTGISTGYKSKEAKQKIEEILKERKLTE